MGGRDAHAGGELAGFKCGDGSAAGSPAPNASGTVTSEDLKQLRERIANRTMRSRNCSNRSRSSAHSWNGRFRMEPAQRGEYSEQHGRSSGANRAGGEYIVAAGWTESEGDNESERIPTWNSNRKYDLFTVGVCRRDVLRTFYKCGQRYRNEFRRHSVQQLRARIIFRKRTSARRTRASGLGWIRSCSARRCSAILKLTFWAIRPAMYLSPATPTRSGCATSSWTGRGTASKS